MNALDQVTGVEGVELARARGAPAQRRGGAHALDGAEDDRAARGACGVGPVADGDPGDGGETLRCHVAHATAKI